jgi:hypothetical protein
MAESLMGIFVVALILGTGYALGYMRGEEHATMLSIKAGWERDAKAWEERHARRMRELGVEVDA